MRSAVASFFRGRALPVSIFFFARRRSPGRSRKRVWAKRRDALVIKPREDGEPGEEEIGVDPPSLQHLVFVHPSWSQLCARRTRRAERTTRCELQQRREIHMHMRRRSRELERARRVPEPIGVRKSEARAACAEQMQRARRVEIACVQRSRTCEVGAVSLVANICLSCRLLPAARPAPPARRICGVARSRTGDRRAP